MMAEETQHAEYERCGQRMFREPDGHEVQCGGPGFCRECNGEAAA